MQIFKIYVIMHLGENAMILEEFDKNKNALFNPDTYSKKVDNCPKLCVSFFSKSLIGEVVRCFNPQIIGHVENATAKFPVYKIEYKNKDIAIYQSPVGAPACVGNFEEVVEMGIKKIILVGCCGCLDEKLEDYSIIIPTSAIRDEGTSYHYAPASDEVALNTTTIKKVETKLKKLNVSYSKGKTWTTDAIYRETPLKIAKRKAQGAITVDMECSAMAVVAKFRNVEFAQIFYAADSLAEDNYQPRSINDHDVTKKGKVIPIALECAIALDD